MTPDDQIESDDPRALLGMLDTPAPPAELTARVLVAAGPLLAAHARRTSWRTFLRPLLVALVPLPLILATDAAIAAGLYALFSLVFPPVVTTVLVAQYALFVLMSLALAYAAVPLIVDRQARATFEEAHA
jgi:hypothetical protein